MSKDVEDKLSSVAFTETSTMDESETKTDATDTETGTTSPEVRDKSTPNPTKSSPQEPDTQQKVKTFFTRIFETSDSDVPPSSGDEKRPGSEPPAATNKSQNNPSPSPTWKVATTSDDSQAKITDREDSARREIMRRNFLTYYSFIDRTENGIRADVEKALRRQKLYRGRRSSLNTPARYRRLDVRSDPTRFKLLDVSSDESSVDEHYRLRKRPLLVDVNDRRRVPDAKRSRSSLRTRLSHGTQSDLDISDANFSLLT